MKKSLTLFYLSFWATTIIAQTQRTIPVLCTDSNTARSYYCSEAFQISQVFGLKDGGSITWGGKLIENIIDHDQYVNLSLFKADAAGNIVWTNKLVPDDNNLFIPGSIKLSESVNGNFIVSGLIETTTGRRPVKYSFIACLSANGQLLWNRFYEPDQGSSLFWEPYDIVCATDEAGNIFFSAQYGITSSVPYQYSNAISKLDAGGQLVWNRLFLLEPGRQFNINIIKGIFVGQDTITLLGGGQRFTAMQLRSTDGLLISLKSYAPVDNSLVVGVDNVYKVKGDRYVTTSANRFLSFSNKIQFSTIILDRGLNPVKSFYLQAFPEYYSGLGWKAPYQTTISTPEGDILYAITKSYQSGGTVENSLYYCRLDESMNIVTQKRLQHTNPAAGGFDLPSLGYYRDGKILVRSTTVSTQTGKPGLDYLSYDRDISSTNACFTALDTNFMQMNTFSLERRDFQYDMIEDNALSPVNFSLLEQAAVFTMEEGCKEINICKTPIISGPDSICLFGGETIFKAAKGQQCFKKVNWNIDTNAVQLMRTVNDSTVAIRFKKNWKGFLYADVNSVCGLADSLKIVVYSEKDEHLLGKDTSLCAGDKFTLDAGSAFSSYNWSTQAVSKTIDVSAKGRYSITAYFDDGCYVRDTVEIIDVFPVSSIKLSATNVLCKGANDILDAGPGMSSYLWQDGSTRQTFTVRQTGAYWAKIINEYGCVSSDTVLFVNEALPPHDFLVKDTAICAYAPIVLKPVSSNYRQFFWSDNTTASSLRVTAPGSYWLQVTDESGCTGRDTILISAKNCPDHFYVPGAFTPNDDGRNDQFKPVITGNIKNYAFSVYNRWGELVFSSTEPGRGWDGKSHQREIATGVYAWMCQYQFQNQSPVIQKGTVMLVR